MDGFLVRLYRRVCPQTYEKMSESKSTLGDRIDKLSRRLTYDDCQGKLELSVTRHAHTIIPTGMAKRRAKQHWSQTKARRDESRRDDEPATTSQSVSQTSRLGRLANEQAQTSRQTRLTWLAGWLAGWLVWPRCLTTHTQTHMYTSKFYWSRLPACAWPVCLTRAYTLASTHTLADRR